MAQRKDLCVAEGVCVVCLAARRSACLKGVLCTGARTGSTCHAPQTTEEIMAAVRRIYRLAQRGNIQCGMRGCAGVYKQLKCAHFIAHAAAHVTLIAF